MQEDLISVIVPVYKVEKYLNKCVQSIVNQSYKNLEIILVDDGSPDKCPQMCDDWSKKDSRIKVIHKENGGVSSARNMGIDIAKGEYIGFVDSDDLVEQNMYNFLVEFLVKNNLDMVNCNLLEISPDDFFKNKVFNIDAKENRVISSLNSYDDIILYKNSHGINPYACCKLFKRSLLVDIRFDIDIGIGEDLLFCLEYIKRIKKIGLVESKLYFYNRQNQSATQTFTNKKITLTQVHEIILNMNLNFSKKVENYIIAKIVLGAAYYILDSIYNGLENDQDNINYAKEQIKKHYKIIRKHEKITLKNKVYIFAALYCPNLYIPIKKLEKLLS